MGKDRQCYNLRAHTVRLLERLKESQEKNVQPRNKEILEFSRAHTLHTDLLQILASGIIAVGNQIVDDLYLLSSVVVVGMSTTRRTWPSYA